MTRLEEILTKYSLTRENTTQYIDAVLRMNRTEAANEIDVSTDTIHRYKRAFEQMNTQERLFLISTLTQEKLLAEFIK